jgi:hypothetical protein
MFDFILKKPFVLYTHDTSVEAVQVDLNKDTFKVLSVGQKIIPSGAIEHGIIKNEKIVSATIAEILKSAKPAPIVNNRCIVAIPESQCFYKLIKLPQMLEPKSLEAEIQRQLEDTVPLQANAIKFDYAAYHLGNEVIVFAVAISREVLAAYYELITGSLHLKPVVFEPEFLSLMRNMLVPNTKKGGSIIVYAHQGSVDWFALWNGIIFDSSADHPCVTESDHELLAKDIRRSEEFFQRVTTQPVQAIVVTGDDNTAKAVQPILKEAFSVPVIFSKKYRVSVSQIVDENIQFNPAIGAALRYWDRGGNMPLNLIKRSL